MAELAPRPVALDDEEAALWRAQAAGSADARERLFALYYPFARALAGRQFRARNAGDIEHADVVQLACTGLLEAMDRYDPARGVPFRAFAARRVNGSIADGVARMNEVREQISFRRRAKRERMRSLAGIEAGELGAGEAMDALIDMAVGLALGFMLDGTSLYREEGTVDVQPTAYDSLAWKELVHRLVAELDRLPERDRSILRLHYLDEVSFDQIAALLGLTKGRISQLHKAALGLLRKRISGAAGFRLQK
jgi:RNA polymerase sigma factor for flagellar operon FliA